MIGFIASFGENPLASSARVVFYLAQGPVPSTRTWGVLESGTQERASPSRRLDSNGNDGGVLRRILELEFKS